MIRLVTTRRLERILAANARLTDQHERQLRHLESAKDEITSLITDNGALTADAEMLRQTLAEHPEYRSMRAEVRSAKDHAAALTDLLEQQQTANEGAYRDALAARLEAHPYTPAKRPVIA